MAIKFVICFEENSSSADNSETNFCKRACKITDNSLVDGDFDLKIDLVDNSIDTVAEYYRSTYLYTSPKPIVIIPQALTGPGGRVSLEYAYEQYPDVPIVTAFHPGGQPLPDLPAAFALDPDRLANIVLVGGGAAGTSEWFTGPGLEFVETSPMMYVSGGSNVLNFPITNVTDQGGGVARIHSVALSYLVLLKQKIHITGVSGFANNINGLRTVAAVSAGSHVDVSFTLGAGTFSGPATAVTHYISGAISAVAAKIHKIMRERDCSFWTARYCARMTGSASGVHANATGYGSIDVDDAIAYASTIIDDPFDNIGAIGTLALSVVDGVAQFSHPEIVNAKSAKLFANGTLIKQWSGAAQMLGKTLSYNHYPVTLGDIDYKLKGYRDNQITNDSNTVNTNITALADLPETPLYEIGFTAYYFSGTQILNSDIAAIRQVVANPDNNNKGEQRTYYTLENGVTVEESQLFASPRDAVAFVASGYVTGNYLNNLSYVDPDYYNAFAATDMCGQDFSNADFTAAGDYDFTDAIVSRSKFTGATMPAAVADVNDFLAAVAFCNKKTTIWTTGNTIEEELNL